VVVAGVIEDPTEDGVVTTAPPPVVASTVNPIAVEDRPINVADAYHGVGVSFCLAGKHPINVADAYHGIGLAVCV
jgi:hypothetical protein